MLVLFAGVTVGVLVFLGLIDLSKSLWHNAAPLSMRNVGTLPISVTTISEHGRRQLDQALILLAQAIENNELHPETAEAARGLLAQPRERTMSPPKLLQQVSMLLLRIEIEDNLISCLTTNRKQAITEWLNNYLNRKVR